MSSISFDVNGTFGALSIGAFISTFLFGICTLQVYLYFITFPEDRWTYKSLVSYVWVLELAHCVCVCDFVYTWTITAYGNPEVLTQRPPLSISTTVLLGALIAQPVQMFFAYRVRVVSEGQLVIAVACWVASGALFGIEVYLYIMAVHIPNLQAFETNYRSLIMTGICLNASIDIVEALSLCYYLRKLQLQSLGRTSIKIHAIIKLTMETGLLKGLSDLSVLTTFVIMHHNFVWLAVYICLTRLHSNSLLASLNSRMFRHQASAVNICYVEKPTASWTSTSNMALNVNAPSRSSTLVVSQPSTFMFP